MIKEIEKKIVFLVFLVIVLINFLNVLSRFVFHKSFSFAEEFLVYGFVWLCLIGIKTGFYREEHLSFELVRLTLKKKGYNFVEFINNILTLILSVFIFVSGIYLVISEIKSGQKTPALNMPEYIGGGAIPFAFFFIVIFFLKKIYSNFKSK